jgi:DNA-binding transcriptional MerR regulator
MYIGEFSRIVNLHPCTLRKFEERGLMLPPMRDYNGRRVYSDEDVQRVKEIISRRQSPKLHQSIEAGT